MTRTPQHERGFTLIEVSTVIVIIGVLATIAIPTLLRHRESAFTAVLESDLSASSTAATSYASGDRGGSYEGLTTDALMTARGRGVSPGVTVTVEVSGRTGYCLRAVHESMPDAPLWLDSRAGIPSEDSCETASY